MTYEPYLKAVEARAEAATPGEWFYDSYSRIYTASKVRNAQLPEGEELGDYMYEVAVVEIAAGDTATLEGSRNATFITHARTDVSVLTARVRELTEALEFIIAPQGMLDNADALDSIESIARAVLAAAPPKEAM